MFRPALFTLGRRNLKTEVSDFETFQMFSIDAKPERFENETITCHFGFALEENSSIVYLSIPIS